MPRHPNDMASGPGRHDEEAVAARERREESSAASVVLDFLRAAMDRGQRQGAASTDVVDQTPNIVAALYDQIIRTIQPRDEAGTVTQVTLTTRDIQRLSRSLCSLQGIQQDWIKLGIEAAKAAGVIIVKGEMDDGGPRRIAYPFRPPDEGSTE